jgi:prepilin-type N-terminal cleavage/methylation domain-containing protein
MRRGFTMVEVLTVLGVLAILTTVAVAGGSAVLERARISRTASDARVVVNALRQYQLDVGVFPAAIEDLTVRPADAPRWKGPYIDRWPAGAAWDRAAIWSYERQAWFDGFPSWGVAVCHRNVPEMALMTKVDRAYDDGDLSAGGMRMVGDCLRIHVGRDP